MIATLCLSCSNNQSENIEPNEPPKEIKKSNHESEPTQYARIVK